MLHHLEEVVADVHPGAQRQERDQVAGVIRHQGQEDLPGGSKEPALVKHALWSRSWLRQAADHGQQRPDRVPRGDYANLSLGDESVKAARLVGWEW
jgi:hypothetical protein